MSPRLSVCAVIAVCLLSCSQTDSTSNEPFSDTKTDLTLGLTKTYFGSPWAESDDITIDFSGDAISFIGYFEGKNSPPKDRSAVVSYVAAPSGEVLYDLSQFASLEAAIAAHRPFTSQSLGLDATALIHWPVADDVEPERGKYTIRVAMQQEAAAQTDGGTSTTEEGADAPTGTFHTVIRRNEGTARGALDLNLFYVTGSEFTTTNDLAVQAAVDTFFSDLEPFGISRGTIQTFDVQSGTPSALDSDDQTPLSGVYRLMQEAKRASNNRALNVFFVNEVKGTNPLGKVTLPGVSVGTPVALGVGASNHSGIVMSTQFFLAAETGSYDTTLMGHWLVHNLGHAVGLQHTTEGYIKDGVVHDLITDTVECPAYADINGDSILTAAECQDSDGSNTMFWDIVPTAHLTAGQGYMIRHSVIVRGEPRNQ